MELFKEILVKVLEKEEIRVAFPDLSLNLTEIIETKSYKILQKIKTVIENDNLSDFDALRKSGAYLKISEAMVGIGTISDDRIKYCEKRRKTLLGNNGRNMVIPNDFKLLTGKVFNGVIFKNTSYKIIPNKCIKRKEPQSV